MASKLIEKINLLRHLYAIPFYSAFVGAILGISYSLLLTENLLLLILRISFIILILAMYLLIISSTLAICDKVGKIDVEIANSDNDRAPKLKLLLEAKAYTLNLHLSWLLFVVPFVFMFIPSSIINFKNGIQKSLSPTIMNNLVVESQEDQHIIKFFKPEYKLLGLPYLAYSIYGSEFNNEFIKESNIKPTTTNDTLIWKVILPKSIEQWRVYHLFINSKENGLTILNSKSVKIDTKAPEIINYSVVDTKNKSIEWLSQSKDIELYEISYLIGSETKRIKIDINSFTFGQKFIPEVINVTAIDSAGNISKPITIKL